MDKHEAKESVVTASDLWTQFVSQEFPNGTAPDVYRQIKMCFYSGMVEFFRIFAEIDQIDQAMIDADDEGMIMENFRQEIVGKNGRAKKAFESWLSECYDIKEVLEEQRKILEETFYRAMEIAFFATSVIAGPNDEDDAIGARRIIRLRTEVFNEMAGMLGVEW